jgi:subtilisin family serine protease
MKCSLRRVLVSIVLVCCLPFAAAGEIAGQDFVAGQVVVGYKEGANISGAIAAIHKGGGRIVKRIGGPGSAMLIDYGSEAKALAAISQLQRQPGVAYVERNGIVRIAPPELKRPQKQGGPGPDAEKSGAILQGAKPLAVSNDPGTGFQYHHTLIRKTAALPALSATPPTVAVLDTGVDWTHPDLAGKVILGRNTVGNNMLPFDDHGHGTHVAGIIAAKAANNAYGEGVCPNCKILAVKVLTSEGWGTWFDIATGMDYARTVATSPPTRVVNMSLGGDYSSLIASQVLALKNAGKVLVAAAGNDNTTLTTYAYPGADTNTALRVMATEQNDCRAWFSNFSPTTAANQYNIAAPGWMIPSTVPDLGYAYYSGTSMSSPVVAGAAALVWGQIPTL